MSWKRWLQILVGTVLVGAALPVYAETLKDPHLRDDDISLTRVSVDVDINAHGHYVYTYDLHMPSENTGMVRTFVLDISCANQMDSRGFDPQHYLSDVRISSRDGRHVPVAVDAPYGQAASFSISVANAVRWLLGARPGESAVGLQLVSPYPPGARQYSLIPSMVYRHDEYDYSDTDMDTGVPWEDDFTVTAITTGPACPGEEYPDNGDDAPRFLGSPFPGQPELNNALLSYSAPLRDQFHVDAGVRELEMTIHYHEDIDPRTFVVTPEKNLLRRLFNPRPGGSETVRIPLEPGKNRIELQVQTAFTPPGQGETPPREARGRGGVAMDRDVFVIRVAGN
jgi:hypothetical protein